MSEEQKYLTCTCNHCGQKLEFAANGVGQEIQCPTCGKPTRLSRSAPIPIPPPARSERSTGDTPKVHCLCPRCKNDFDFELGLLGQAVHCPGCQWQGVPTRGDVELSDFQALGIDVESLVRRLRNEPTGAAQPKPSIPVPSPIRPAGADDSTRKLTAQNQTLIPPKPAARCIAPPQMDSDRRILSAFLLCLFFGIFGVHAFYAGRILRGAIFILFLIGLLVGFSAVWYEHEKPERVKQLSGWADTDYSLSESERRLSESYSGNAAADHVLEAIKYFNEAEQHRREADSLMNTPTRSTVALFPIAAISLGILFICDFISIIAGAFRDGEGRKITRWT